MGTDDAALVKVFKELLHGDKSKDLLLGEPKAGQGEFGFAGRRLLVTIAAKFSVVDDGRVEPVAHVFEIAFESGEGDLENGEEIVSTDDFAVLEELVDFVEAF